MTWTQPGGNGGGKKDPWTGRNNTQSPPNLDEAIRKLYKKLVNRWSHYSKQGSSPAPFSKLNPWAKVGVLLLALGLIWIVSGIFVVNSSESAIISRFGRYSKTVGAGLHWIPTFIETKSIINHQKIFEYSYEGEALTSDAQNIVLINLVVQYRIVNANSYLFATDNARAMLHQAVANAAREVIGQTTVDAVFSSERAQINQQIKAALSRDMQNYKTGLLITDVVLQKVNAPDKVKDAFAGVVKASQDALALRDQAEAYAEQVKPVAESQAKSMLAEAEAYKQQAVLRAQSEVAPFLALLPAYQQSPALLRERLYMSTMETVLTNTRKILVDVNAHDVIYLPLNKLRELSKPQAPLIATANPADVDPTTAAAVTTATRSDGYGSSVKGGYE